MGLQRSIIFRGDVFLAVSASSDGGMWLCWLYLWRFEMGRFVDLTKNLFNEFKKQTHPHAIIPVRMNGHAVSGDIVHRVLAFAFAILL